MQNAEPDQSRAEQPRAGQRNERSGCRDLAPAAPETRAGSSCRITQADTDARDQQELGNDRVAPGDPAWLLRHFDVQPSEVGQVVDEVVRDHLHDRQAAHQVVRGEGMYRYAPDGRALIDAWAGLFCVAAGHCRLEIAQAVFDQLKTLDYGGSFLRAHPKAFELANRITEYTPAQLNRVFFVNS